MTDAIDSTRRRLLGAGAVLVAGSRIGFYTRATDMMAHPGYPAHRSELAALRSATAWINSPALGVADLQGKVVLIDVCTYTCINWLRTLARVRQWAEKYGPHGLVVIGVHCPEFTFEQDERNVRRAVKDMHIRHALAIDNSFAIWRAFENRYWPSRYLIDARGRMRHRQFGEGNYESSERAIQQALSDAGWRTFDRQTVSVSGQGIEAQADWSTLKSPEMYLGHDRAEHFATPREMGQGMRRRYSAPRRLNLNEWALSGDWTIGPQAASLDGVDGRIECRFHARDLHLVLGPAADRLPVRFRVLIDGRAPADAYGVDINADGIGTITEPRLYQLIRQRGAVGERQFTIEFSTAGAEAYAFTFG